jgi:formylglycine-generating enzyme required for sulfatase activity
MYQMSGNTVEWCADWSGKNAYERYKTGDLSPPSVGISRVMRGGSWGSGFSAGGVDPFRCAHRGYNDPEYLSPFYCFRCARA